MLRTTTVSANHTFQEGGNPAEKLVNVTVGVPDREKVEIDMLKNATVNQRLQVRKQVPIFVFSVKAKQGNSGVVG